MRDNLARDVQLSDLAHIAGLSLHHFARMFKQNTGTSPHAFLMAARMEKARELLTHSTLPISEVAALVGYSAPSTFARLFRAAIGESPLNYRQITRPLAASRVKGDFK
jgi:AraC family transcriptional regulator